MSNVIRRALFTIWAGVLLSFLIAAFVLFEGATA